MMKKVGKFRTPATLTMPAAIKALAATLKALDMAEKIEPHLYSSDNVNASAAS